jgi:hypothetical protein
MRKVDELAHPMSCLNRARDDEFIFVLLARDVAAPAAIRYWVDQRIKLLKNFPSDPQILHALEVATQMEKEQLYGYQRLSKSEKESGSVSEGTGPVSGGAEATEEGTT